MPVIASDAVKLERLVVESTRDAATLTWYFEEDILEQTRYPKFIFFASQGERSTVTSDVLEFEFAAKVFFDECNVEKGVFFASEICCVVRMQCSERIIQVEVLDEAIKGAQKHELVRWPLLLHVLLHSGPVEGIAILVGHNDLVAVKSVHAELYCNPLVIGKVNYL